MRFVIRDDDLNFFSAPSDIDRWYSDLFDSKIPVGFAAVPFVKSSSDIFKKEKIADGVEYRFSDNRVLSDYIKKQPMIEIIQHGCTHEVMGGVYEYAQNTDLFGGTKRGKVELENALGKTIRVFSPPHDWIGVSGIKAVESVGMDIIRGRGAGLRNFIPRKEYLLNFIKMAIFRFPKYISTNTPVYPFVLNFGAHKEMCSYRLEDPDIFSGLESVAKRDGDFVVVAHLHSYDEAKKSRLRSLIEKAKTMDSEFVSPSDLFK